jgi:hypothetical protein
VDSDLFRSHRLKQLYGYWRSKAPPGRLPARADLDPGDIPQLLPYIFMIDVEHEPRRFRFRLIGTQICTWAGRDVTGWYLDDPSYGPRGAIISSQYAEVVDRGVPFYTEQPAARPERDYIFYERLVLPLAADGRTIDILLCGVDVLTPTPELRAGRFRRFWDEAPPQ